MATAADRSKTVTPIKAAKKPEAGTVHWLNECIERGKREVFSEITLLTPGLAGELLRRNPDNRGIRETKAEQYAADMRAGNWQFNGEPIIISADGLTNDGQHRAYALINANVILPMLFVFGVGRDTRTTVDQGAARSASDYLSMEGVANATVRASVARQLIAYERSEGKSISAANYVTNAEVLARVHGDEELAKSSTFAASHAKAARLIAAPAVIGFCHYLLSDISSVEANQYLTQVCNGEGLSKRDPAYVVRERLIGMGRSGKAEKIHIIFRGWNAYRQGRKPDHVKVVGRASNLPALV